MPCRLNLRERERERERDSGQEKDLTLLVGLKLLRKNAFTKVFPFLLNVC